MGRGVDGPAVPSGSKYETESGRRAVKNGQRPRGDAPPAERKPPWLRLKLEHSPRYGAVKALVKHHGLATVCEESHCPNMSECWSHGTATLMLMGSVCTRACRFCAVDTGNPGGFLDAEEPQRVAETVETMGLRYVVLTSVDRDDLPDGGAAHYAATIAAIKARTPEVVVEALTPDFAGSEAAVRCLVDSGVDVFAQNLETVERLTQPVRDPRAGYGLTLDVLRTAKALAPAVLTKSSLMLGLGETEDELFQAMDDLRDAGVSLLTLGQYLRPTLHHLPVVRWVPPEDFERYREAGLARGFREVASGPLVRSSYRADRVFAQSGGALPTLVTPPVAEGLIPLRTLNNDS